MDIKKIKAIVDLVTGSNIAELEIKEGEETLKITTIGGVAPQVIQQQQPQHIYHTQPQAMHHAHAPSPINELTNTATPPVVAQPSTDVVATGYSDHNYIKSPMVGTFYRSSSPSSASFVEVGSEVKVGQVLCIIEAMKLMNQIESDKAGIIKEILNKDGAPVEYGQTLFVIE